MPALKTLLSYLTLYIVWSSTYLAIKYAVQGFDPFAVVGLRFFVGGAGLATFAWVAGMFRTRLSARQWRNTILVGILLLVGGNGLVTVAQKHVDSYIAALIIASTPMFVVIWDRILIGRRISILSAVGIAIGIAGVAVLLYKPSGHAIELSGSVWLIVLAVVSWALGTTLGKRLDLPANPAVLTAIQQVLCGVACLAVTPAVYGIPDRVPPMLSILSVCYLAVFGSVSLVAYTYLVKHEPNERVVSYAFVNPLGAALLGIVVAKESAVPLLGPAMVLILAGLFLMFYGAKVLGWVRASVGQRR